MKIPMYQVDAFSQSVFGGNPAAVCPLESWIYDATMQRIAAENNLSETAFLVPRGGEFEIRWFTPEVEVPLCGHATLASGWVVLHELEPQRPAVRFFSKSGELVVARDGEKLAMRLPRYDPKPAIAPASLVPALGAPPREVLATDTKFLCIYDGAEAIVDMKPDMAALARLDKSVCVTAPGGAFGCDFVSRFFAPGSGIPEDPVTGSAHCLLTPYWAGRLKRVSLFAKQISKRGGEIWCLLGDKDVTLTGHVAPYFVGEIDV
jgi:PhzF family phenazine biosynthesis protein